MSDWWLNALSNWGQLLAALLALLAAFVGFFATYATNQLTLRSNADLVAAAAIIKDLKHRVGTVIGGEWPPLTAAQIEALREDIVHWQKPEFQIQVMYENEFGKALAQSIVTAFQAAGWKVMFSTGSGFGRGIEVGPGAIGPKMRDSIARITGSSEVRALREEEPDRGAWFVGVGAKVD